MMQTIVYTACAFFLWLVFTWSATHKLRTFEEFITLIRSIAPQSDWIPGARVLGGIIVLGELALVGVLLIPTMRIFAFLLTVVFVTSGTIAIGYTRSQGIVCGCFDYNQTTLRNFVSRNLFLIAIALVGIFSIYLNPQSIQPYSTSYLIGLALGLLIFSAFFKHQKVMGREAGT